MAEPIRFELTETISTNWPRYKKVHNMVDNKARIMVGIQLINNIVNGSPTEPTVPPILTGRLRGSGSVFLGGKNVYETPKYHGEGTPNRSFSGKEGVVTIGFNTEYAARWHEETFEPGVRSQQSGDVGNKYVERHLRADGKELMQLYANILKEETK